MLHAHLCQLESEYAAHEIATRAQIDRMVAVEPLRSGSAASASPYGSMHGKVTQMPARLADSSLMAMGSASRAGFFCVSRNLVCMRRGLPRAEKAIHSRKIGKEKGLSLSQSPSPLLSFFSTGVLQGDLPREVLQRGPAFGSRVGECKVGPYTAGT